MEEFRKGQSVMDQFILRVELVRLITQRFLVTNMTGQKQNQYYR